MVDLERLRKLLTPGASLRDEAEVSPSEIKAQKPTNAHANKSKGNPSIRVAVTTKENYLVCKSKRIYATKKESLLFRVQKNDILIFYITKLGQFPGVIDRPIGSIA